MSTPPRRLSFAVGTSLLTASLSLGAVACTEGKPKEEPPPDSPQTEKPDPEERHVNTGYAPEEPQPQPEVAPEQIKTNPGPEPQEPVLPVNPGPEPEQPPPPSKPPEGAGINVGPQPDPKTK